MKDIMTKHFGIDIDTPGMKTVVILVGMSIIIATIVCANIEITIAKHFLHGKCF